MTYFVIMPREPSVEMLAAAYQAAGIPKTPMFANAYRAMVAVAGREDRVSQEREDHILDCYAVIEEQKSEISKLRKAIEIIAGGSADQLQVLQAKAALANIGPPLTPHEPSGAA